MTLIGFARSLRDLPARWRFRAALRRRAFSLPVGEPVLSFGEAFGKAGERVHGGRVKLGHLARGFARDEERFNVLYFVSSAIPPHACELVRWAKARGAKFVWNQNGVGFPAWAGSETERWNRPMRQLLRLADFVVYQSAFCRESADRFLGKPRCESAVLFNPVDLAAFSPAPEPPGLECCRLLAAGTHNQSFRVLGAIETVKHLRKLRQPAHLTIAGELRWPRAKLDVKEAIARCGVLDAVELRPAFSQGEAAEMLRASHVLLHAKYHDPCPTMVLEALACGVPVVGSRSGGMPELLGPADEAGELLEVPLGWDRAEYPHPLALAEAVARIMIAWPERSRMARARAERLFGAEAWLREHARIFERVLAAS